MLLKQHFGTKNSKQIKLRGLKLAPGERITSLPNKEDENLKRKKGI